MAEHLFDPPQEDTETGMSCTKCDASGAIHPKPVSEEAQKGFAVAGALPGMTEQEALDAMEDYFDVRQDCTLHLGKIAEARTLPLHENDVAYVHYREYRATCGDRKYDIHLSVPDSGERVLRVNNISAVDDAAIDRKS